ncbi:hypothetical protein QL285_031368 [Trifolium repens]|nr:hypothetical protein QL285_031368 [Trifolium repens]
MRPDRSWMMRRKDNNGQVTEEFKNGVDDFIKIAKRQLGVADVLGRIFCPCFKYAMGDDLSEDQNLEEDPNPSASKFYTLLRDADEPLWVGCHKHTKLSAVTQLLNLKSEFNMSESCYDRMIVIIKSMLPETEKLPENFYRSKKMVKDLGLGYEKIDACPNHCMLYDRENKDPKVCSACLVCNHPRFKPKARNKAKVEGSICEAYNLEEVSNFASIYFDPKLQTRHTKVPRNDDGGGQCMVDECISIFKYPCRPIGKGRKRFLTDGDFQIAETYMLVNCKEVESFLQQFEDSLRQSYLGITDDQILELRDRDFSQWIKQQVSLLNSVEH